MPVAITWAVVGSAEGSMKKRQIQQGMYGNFIIFQGQMVLLPFWKRRITRILYFTYIKITLALMMLFQIRMGL